MFVDQGFLLFFAAILVFLFFRAWKHGVVGMLWGVTGALGGILVGLAAWDFFVKSLNLSNPVKAGVCFVIGLMGYAMIRQIAKSILQEIFDRDGPLHFFRGGPGGAILSLIPGLITIGIVAFCLRVGGTLADLDRFEKVSIEGVDFLTPNYPRRSIFSKWRDGVERIGPVGGVLEMADPLCPVAERNLAALLITTKKATLFNVLSQDPETRPLMTSPIFQALRADPEIHELNMTSRHVALMRNPKIQQAALDPSIRTDLLQLELHRVVDAFMLSPARQEMVKSLTRPEDMR